MENKYLEKIAANKLKQHLMAGGASFGDSRIDGATNQSINAAYASHKPTSRIATGDKVTTSGTVGKKGFLGMGKVAPTAPVTKATGATRVTGDILASGKSLAERGAAFKAMKAKNVSTGGVKGILGKATSLIRKNPLASAGIALGAGILGHKALSSNKSEVQYSNY